MHTLRATVHRGRLIVDEPTERAEGEIVELVPLDEVLASGGDLLDEAERERLHASLRESLRQMDAGETMSAEEALARLRAAT